ncbi:MAG: hypothetical protein KGI54_16170 [Pseudomonadota bacterium]|nr:hypothetical protein [Pseudomonadota bacterium]
MDAYKVFVSLGMKNGISAGLRTIQAEVFGLKKTVDLTTGSFSRMQAAVVGAMAGGTGFALGKAYMGLADAGGKVLTQQGQILSLTGQQRDVAQATAEAYRDIAISNTTIAGNLGAFQQLRGVFRDSGEAIKGMSAFLKGNAVFQGFGGTASEFGKAIKALDIQGAFVNAKGQFDVSRLAPAIGDYNAAFGLSHGLLTPADLLNYTKMAGPAASMMDTHAYLRDNLELMLGLGRTGGRGEAYAIKDLIGGNVSKALAASLYHLGIVQLKNLSVTAGHYAIKRGGLQNEGELTSRNGGLIRWFYDTVLPDMQKHGYKLNAAGLAQALGSLPATTLRALTFALTNKAQVEAGMKKFDQASALSPEQYHTMMATNYGLAKSNLASAFTSLWQALGTSPAQVMISTLNELASGIRNLTQWVGAHPGYAKMLTDMLGALAVGFTVLGVAFGAAAIVGLVGSGGLLAGLALGVTGFGVSMAAFNWKSLTADFNGAVIGFENGIKRVLYDITHPGQLLTDLTPGATPAPAGAPAGHWAIVGHGTRVFLPDQTHVTQTTSAHNGQGLHEAWNAVKAWVDSGAPVTVTNSHDIASAAKTGLSGAVAMHQGYPRGPTGLNNRPVFPGTAGLAAP